MGLTEEQPWRGGGRPPRVCHRGLRVRLAEAALLISIGRIVTYHGRHHHGVRHAGPHRWSYHGWCHAQRCDRGRLRCRSEQSSRWRPGTAGLRTSLVTHDIDIRAAATVAGHGRRSLAGGQAIGVALGRVGRGPVDGLHGNDGLLLAIAGVTWQSRVSIAVLQLFQAAWECCSGCRSTWWVRRAS